MILQKLEVFDLRNLREISIQPGPGINFIFGKNGSGKSSLLEAIYILGRAKSFRSTTIRPVISIGKDSLIVSAKARTNQNANQQMGIKLGKSKSEIRINCETVKSRSVLAHTLPLQIIHPKSYKLLDAGPQMRRQFIDWGVFNYQDEFLESWRRYKKALSQRNHLLKQHQTGSIKTWNHEIIQYGQQISDWRQEYLDLLRPLIFQVTRNFLDCGDMQIEYIQGWEENHDFASVLEKDLERDLRHGMTHSGPHRADFKFNKGQVPAKDYFSRGQLKLLVLAFQLAQMKLLHQKCSKIGCILIDDITSELDQTNRIKLIKLLSGLNVQVFMTATELQEFGDLSYLSDYHMFHVEHGKINPV